MHKAPSSIASDQHSLPSQMAVSPVLWLIVNRVFVGEAAADEPRVLESMTILEVLLALDVVGQAGEVFLSRHVVESRGDAIGDVLEGQCSLQVATCRLEVIRGTADTEVLCGHCDEHGSSRNQNLRIREVEQLIHQKLSLRVAVTDGALREEHSETMALLVLPEKQGTR